MVTDVANGIAGEDVFEAIDLCIVTPKPVGTSCRAPEKVPENLVTSALACYSFPRYTWTYRLLENMCIEKKVDTVFVKTFGGVWKGKGAIVERLEKPCRRGKSLFHKVKSVEAELPVDYCIASNHWLQNSVHSPPFQSGRTSKAFNSRCRNRSRPSRFCVLKAYQ